MKRVQMKRTRGWKKPANTVYVGRPTEWGNPYSISEYGREAAIDHYEYHLLKMLDAFPDFLDALKGKDLACWCPLDKPCHADVLLEFLEKEAHA